MAASDWAYFNHDKNEYGYWTEDGGWHPISADPQPIDQ